MTGQVDKQVFQVGLPNLDVVEVGHVRCEFLQALADIRCNDLDDAQVCNDEVFDAAEVSRDVRQGQLDNQSLILFAKQCIRCSLRDNLARIHDRDLIAQHLRLVHVMRGKNDRCAAGTDALHEVPEIAPTSS